jgi:two-component system, response regulator PdtaR
MKILILEDDVMIAEVLSENLKDAGYEVCGIASSASVAVGLARTHRPDVAIVDINLGGGRPGTSFPALLNPQWPLGILYATGLGSDHDLADVGGTAVIVKPYSMATLVAALTIVSDIVANGVTTRRLPAGMRLLG